ncbi:phiSA1p31-related protein [Streptomyces virginiae]|uniref:phiSA1p31-related protein n=1 Tax=Streptomyces virginiae TaxID=1961 RepID=UPI003321CED8
MASAQYETATRTVEETLVVLKLTEDEADALREIVGASDGTRLHVGILKALEQIGHGADGTYTPTVKAYDLSAAYRDRSGDVWTFTGRRAPDGEPYVTYTDTASNTDRITDIEREWGPLTKVTD